MMKQHDQQQLGEERTLGYSLSTGKSGQELKSGTEADFRGLLLTGLLLTAFSACLHDLGPNAKRGTLSHQSLIKIIPPQTCLQINITRGHFSKIPSSQICPGMCQADKTNKHRAFTGH